MAYGLHTPTPTGPIETAVIGRVEKTLAGNVALSIGRSRRNRVGWVKVEHVTLSPDEALALAAELIEHARGGENGA